MRAARVIAVLVGSWFSCLVLDAQQAAPGQLPADLTTDPAELTKEKKGRRVFLELRLAETEPVRGLAFEATVKSSKKKIYLHYTTLATHNDVRKASVVERSGQYDLALTLSPEAAASMKSATTRHVGRPIAVIVDGEVVAALTVRNAIGSDVVFSGAFTRAEATRIAEGLQRW